MPPEATDQATALPAPLARRRGHIVFRARRPTALVLPLAAVTEIAGVLCLLTGATIGWFVLAAPVVSLGVTTLFMRPTVEITRDGVLQRQYLYSSLTRWDAIAHVGMTHVGNLTIVAYRLRPGIPPPRRQPAAVMLRAADAPYDGGWFANSLVGKPDEVLGVVERYLGDPALRDELPVTRRSRQSRPSREMVRPG